MLGALLTLSFVAVFGFVALVVVLAMFGLAVGILVAVLGLLIKALPLVLAAWLAYRFMRRASRNREGISAADQRWLDS